MRIVVTDQNFGGLDHEYEIARRFGHDLLVYDCNSADDTRRAVEGANVVFNNFAPVDEDVLASMAQQAVLIRYGVGVDNVDVDAATKAGIAVCNVPDYGAAEVADHAAAMILALLRRLPQYNTAVHSGLWGAKDLVPDLPAVRDGTIGLLGFGRIAQQLAKRLSGFECRLITSDPFGDASVAGQFGVDMVDFDELVERSNVLSLHLPLLPGTRHIVGADVISRLPDNAIVVNVSRGGLVDEAAVAKALQSKKLSGAALDVFEIEPLSAHSTLLGQKNLIVTPHAAFYSNRSLDSLQRLAAEEAGRYLRGEPLRCKIN